MSSQNKRARQLVQGRTNTFNRANKRMRGEAKKRREHAAIIREQERILCEAETQKLLREKAERDRTEQDKRERLERQKEHKRKKARGQARKNPATGRIEMGSGSPNSDQSAG